MTESKSEIEEMARELGELIIAKTVKQLEKDNHIIPRTDSPEKWVEISKDKWTDNFGNNKHTLKWREAKG